VIAFGYLKMLTEHVSAVEGLSEVALESSCREIVESHKFLPAAPEVLKLVRKHSSSWHERQWAMDTDEEQHHHAIAALQQRGQQREQQEHEQKVRTASWRVQNAMHETRRCAREIAAKEAELASWRARHAEAETRESESLRALRKLTTPPVEAEAEAAEAAARYNGSGPKLL
jgi:hypothetical protein